MLQRSSETFTPVAQSLAHIAAQYTLAAVNVTVVMVAVMVQVAPVTRQRW